MRKIKGFKGDTVVVHSVSFDYETMVLEALVSFVDTTDDSMSVVAQTRCTTWSEDTKDLLEKFISQLESDVCKTVGTGSKSFGREGILEALGETDES